MEVKIVDVDKKNFNLIPRLANKMFNCQECFYWIGKKDGRLDQVKQKANWLAKKTKIYGSLAKILLWGKRLKPVGFTQLGPINEFKTAEMFYQDRLAIPRGGWCITCIAIQSAYRGKGLAKRLINNVLLDLKRRGIKTVDAYPLRRASSWNRVSGGPLELWQGLGFKLVLEDKPKELIIMRKKL